LRSTQVRRVWLLIRAASAQDLGTANQQTRVDAESPTDQSEYDNSADAQATANARHSEAAGTFSSSIFYILAAGEIVQTHGMILFRDTLLRELCGR